MKKIILVLLITLFSTSGLSIITAAEVVPQGTTIVIFYPDDTFRIIVDKEMNEVISELIPSGLKIGYGVIKIYCCTPDDKKSIRCLTGKCQ